MTINWGSKLTRHSEHPARTRGKRRASSPLVRLLLVFVMLTTMIRAAAAINVTALFPENGGTAVCPDAPIRITFSTRPAVGGNGLVRIYSAGGALVDEINPAGPPVPKPVAGAVITNLPAMVSGNTVILNPRPGALEYGQSYYVSVDPGVVTFEEAAPLLGLADRQSWRFSTKPAPPTADATKLIVAEDGSGDFCTVQGAVDFIPPGNTRPVLVEIRNGHYYETVAIRDKHNITLRGQDRKGTVITYPNNAKLNNSVWRAMFNVEADDITLENLTLRNSTPKGGSQAEALRVDGRRCALLQSDFSSLQDTLKLTGTVFASDCYIEGDVDYIWGYGASYFQRCEIRSLHKGYITQIRNDASTFGSVFVDCRLTAAPGVSNVVLSRIENDRFPASHVAFINCSIGEHVSKAAWTVTMGTNDSTSGLRFWEYQSTDLSGKTALDVSARHPASRQLTGSEAAQMRDVVRVLDGWQPQASRLNAPQPSRSVPAFPGAEGFGAGATGGRGGRVIAVTNLKDRGPGSLRDALDQAGPRTVVFEVSGTIPLESPLVIQHGDLTIAGQTAPGDGICLRNYNTELDGATNVIIRYLRLRPGDISRTELDGLSGRAIKDVILDHCTVSWGVDECLSLYHAENLTVQWCLVSESLWASNHRKGNHGYGGIWGGTNASWHHNLLAHHSSRNPRFARDCVNTDFRNNVVYNWGFNSAYGGERSAINMVNNFFKPGPATDKNCRNRILDAAMPGGRWHVTGNHVDGHPEISADNWAGGVHRPYAPLEQIRADVPFPFAPVRTQSAVEAFDLVLAHAGAALPRRDSIDERILAEVRTGTARFGETYAEGGKGIINSQHAVGGWPELKSLPASPDADRDGMPDAWEIRFGFNPNDPADGPKDADGDGYTNLEEYLNSTNPREFVDYTDANNNIHSLNQLSKPDAPFAR